MKLSLVVRLLLPLALAVIARPAAADFAPVTPDAQPETRALLAALQSLSGRYLLTGQHNYPNVKSANSEFAAQYTGKTPAIFSTDWGHAKAGDSDSYLARPDIVQEAIRQHRKGALVTICWHAIPPTADEPGTFLPLPGADPKRLASVQGRLLDEQFKDILTPGTALHQKWCDQVDVIAGYLKQLEDAHVPVLWRPYHEMNGDWFWWGNRTGQYSTIALYRQLFDRLVHHHHLKNLIWVWSVDRPNKPGMEHAKFFPGLDFVDILALDVYHNDFKQSYYDSLLALSGGKPITLAEVGNPPSSEIQQQQPNWIYYVIWAGMVRNTTRREYGALMANSRMLGLNDPAYARVMANYLAASAVTLAPPDFSGTWVLDEDRSRLDRAEAAGAPVKLEISQQTGTMSIRSTRILEYQPDEVTEEKLPLDGTEARFETLHSPRVVTARVDPASGALEIESTLQPVWAPGTKFTTKERWTVHDRTLTIERQSHSRFGAQNVTLVYQKQ